MPNYPPNNMQIFGQTLWTLLCSCPQLDCSLPWRHRTQSRLLSLWSTTMTFSVSFCSPSLQAPKRGRQVTILLCALRRMAPWQQHGPGRKTHAKRLQTFQIPGWRPLVLLLDCSRLQFWKCWKQLSSVLSLNCLEFINTTKRLTNSCQTTCNGDINISTNSLLGEILENVFADKTWLACEALHGTDPFIILSCWHWLSQSFSLCLQALIAEYSNNAPASQNINLEDGGNENTLEQTSKVTAKTLFF